jgi:hypothetical protein
MLIHNPGKTLIEKAPRPRDFESLFLIDIAHTEPLLAAIQAYPSARPFMGGESFAFGMTGPVGWKFARVIGLRPDPPAGVTLTAKAYGQDPATFGSGITATLPGEAYANFGVIGIVTALAVFGVIAGWLRRRAVQSMAPGTIVLYATAVTTLFAMFADYSGQLIRGGAVLLGTAAALVAGTRDQLPVRRLFVVASSLLAVAGLCLLLRRFAGPPPESIAKSTIPLYVGGLVALILACVVVRHSRADQKGSQHEPPPKELPAMMVSSTRGAATPRLPGSRG